MRVAAERAGIEIEVESAATGEWHIGHPPDPRSVAVAERYGVDISEYRARRVRGEDFRRFDYVLAMDSQNLRDLRKMAPSDTSARLALLMDFVPGRAGEAVNDPYYQDDIAFEVVWRDVSVAAEALVEAVRADR